MTIKEVEEKTGLSRSNIRFYEKEKLIQPLRNNKNDYRDYTEKDVEEIKKIAYLRTLGVSVSHIYSIINHEVSLKEVISKQEQLLDKQIVDLEQARYICKMMIQDDNINYDNLNIGDYVPEIKKYWNLNKKIFKLDSVSFIHMWGGTLVWAIITGVCLFIALLTYPNLPEEIPIQYRNGQASSTANKIFIFAYPVLCIIIRLFFRIYFRWKLQISNQYISNLISDYLTNFLSFLVLSAEFFSILFINGYVKNIIPLLFIDAIVLIGALAIGLKKYYYLQADKI